MTVIDTSQDSKLVMDSVLVWSTGPHRVTLSANSWSELHIFFLILVKTNFLSPLSLSSGLPSFQFLKSLTAATS